jgi:hypothetical protein
MIGQKFFEDFRGVWIGGPTAFLPASQRGEGYGKIKISQNSDRFALRQPISFAPGCEFVDDRRNFAFPQISGKHFTDFHFSSLGEFSKAFAFLFWVRGRAIHSVSQVCDMSHKMTIVNTTISKVLEAARAEINLSWRKSARACQKQRFLALWSWIRPS